MENDEKAVVEQDGEGKAQAVEETKVENAEVDSGLEDFSKFEPEVRKRPIDYIEERRARRAERPADNGGEGEQLDEEGLSPKAQEFLRREAEKLINPIKSFVAEDYNKREIAEVVSQKPEWAKYKVLAEKYMKAEGWHGVPAKNIFEMIDYKYATTRGAEEAQQKEVQSRRARGGESASARAAASKGGKTSAEDIMKLSPQQAAELQKRLLQGETIQTQ